MGLERFTFRQLNADSEIKSFDCGDADLNDFLFSEAVNYQKSLMAITYLLEDKKADKTVAYFSLLNDKVVFDPEEKKQWNKLNRKIANAKRRKEYPAVKIGRLAVDQDYVGQNIGSEIILLVQHMFATNPRSACRFLTVDAYAVAVPFYQKNDFLFLSEKDIEAPTRAMFLDLITYPHD